MYHLKTVRNTLIVVIVFAVLLVSQLVNAQSTPEAPDSSESEQLFFVSLEFTINDPDKYDEIVELFAEINQSKQGDDGVIIHDFYANLWESNRIRFYAEFESLEAMLASESDPTYIELSAKVFAYQESGALTVDFGNLRRYELKLENKIVGSH